MSFIKLCCFTLTTYTSSQYNSNRITNLELTKLKSSSREQPTVVSPHVDFVWGEEVTLAHTTKTTVDSQLAPGWEEITALLCCWKWGWWAWWEWIKKFFSPVRSFKTASVNNGSDTGTGVITTADSEGYNSDLHSFIRNFSALFRGPAATLLL